MDGPKDDLMGESTHTQQTEEAEEQVSFLKKWSWKRIRTNRKGINSQSLFLAIKLRVKNMAERHILLQNVLDKDRYAVYGR